jgi:hypothetical protein
VPPLAGSKRYVVVGLSGPLLVVNSTSRFGYKPVTSTSYSLRPMKATVTSHLLPKAAATGRAGCGPDLDDVGVPCRLVRLLRCKREHLLDRPRDDGMRLDADQRLLHVGNRQRERRRTRDRSRKGTGTVPEREREGLRAGGGGLG